MNILKNGMMRIQIMLGTILTCVIQIRIVGIGVLRVPLLLMFSIWI